MLLLLNVLRNANSAEYRELHAKAMECARLIGRYLTSPPCVSHAIVSSHRGRARNFRTDAGASYEYRVRLSRFPHHEVSVPTGGPCRQSSQSERYNLPHPLIATWAKVCQTMGLVVSFMPDPRLQYAPYMRRGVVLRAGLMLEETRQRGEVGG